MVMYIFNKKSNRILFNHEIIYTHSVRFSNQITTKAVVFPKKYISSILSVGKMIFFQRKPDDVSGCNGEDRRDRYRETVGNVAERTSINRLCELKHDTDFFQRHAFNHQPELRTLGFFVRRGKRVVLREERKTFHATTFVLHGCVCVIVLRHLRAHVTDDGLYHGKRDACKSGVVAERVTARMQILHTDGSRPAFRFPRGLNPKPLKELFDPVGNPWKML